MIDKKKCVKKELRNVILTIRITKSMKRFMKKHKLLPSPVFISALKELGFKK